MRSALAGLLAAVIVTIATGCSAPDTADPGLPVGSSSRDVTFDGTTRSFRVYRPSDTDENVPLVLVYHGWGGDAASSEAGFGWNVIAERERFVVAYPEGVDSSFNAGGCCGTAAQIGTDDVATALAIVDDISRSAAIDPARIYATGFSNGAAMTYRLACTTKVFAAFGPVGGGQLVSCTDPAPTSILHIHGASDTVAPLAGDLRGEVLGHPPVEETLAKWRTRQQCEPPVTSSSVGVRRSTASCAGGREIQLMVVDRLSHTWPTPADGLDGTETLWRFFADHRR